jgi:hypothetical protein
MTQIILTKSSNADLNNPSAKEVTVTKEICSHEGRTYKKRNYELSISSMTRVLNIIAVIVLSIFTAFIALAFPAVRKLWTDGIEGKEALSVYTLKKPEISYESEESSTSETSSEVEDSSKSEPGSDIEEDEEFNDFLNFMLTQIVVNKLREDLMRGESVDREESVINDPSRVVDVTEEG